MPRIPFRFTIRSMIIAVALVALNLAGAVATPKGDWGGMGLGGWGKEFAHFDRRVEYGVACFYGGPIRQTNGRIGARLTEVWRLPLPPALLQVWSPVIASASITLLVLTVCLRDSGALPESVPADVGWRGRSLPPHLWFAARWVMVAIALIGLNLASALYQPTFDLYKQDPEHPANGSHAALPGTVSGKVHLYVLQFVGDFGTGVQSADTLPEPPPYVDLQLGYHDLFTAIPRVLNLAIDGTTVERCAMEVDGMAQKRLPEVLFQDSPMGEATIDFKPDGSIIGYEGRPGRIMSRPRVLRPPSFSFLEMRWPMIACASTTVLVLAVTLRHLNRRQIRRLVLIVALAAINLAGVFVSYAIGERPRLLSETWGFAGAGEQYFSDGSRHFHEGGLGTPRRVTRIERPNPEPSLLQTWWPILASTSITVLVLGILLSQARWNWTGLSNNADTVTST